MLLRPRQKQLVTRSVDALNKHGNTLAVAPTGAGKTIMLSAIIGEMFKSDSAKACVLAHRDELTAQNEGKFRRVNPTIDTSVYDASVKSWDGDVTFAMVQTLSRESNLAKMPPVDVLVID
jgi:superfamily II DNA or RNA helicase